MRPAQITLLLGLALALAGCKGGDAAQKKKKERPPVAVQVMELQPRSIVRTLSYDGDVQGEHEVRVFAQVAERILSLPVEEGDAVKQGQVLAILRAETLSEGVRSAIAAVEAARADRDNLKDEHKRAEELLKRNVVARAQVDTLRARVLSAEAQIRRLEAMSSQAATAKSYAFVRAPITGTVGRRYLSQGDIASPALPILTLVRSKRVEIVVEVPEQDLAQIREGMAVAARVQRYGDQPFHGKVVLLAPTIDRQTRTARVKVRLENPDGRLMPGMLARVSFEVERRDKAVVVPYTAVVIETGAEGEVAYRGFVVADGKAVERTLAMGIIEGDQVEIRSGLGFGELLVTQGGQLLEKGHRVEIVERLDKDGKPLRQGAAPAESKQPASAESSSGGKR